MSQMQEWKVISKRQDRDGDGVALVLVVEREGCTRQAVVSGVTWLDAHPGGIVKLSPAR